MPSKLDAPVLTVDVGLIHKVDTRNVENLFSMWTVFSRCAGSLEEGRRLENLSWRLWNRETFCCEPAPEANATTPAISISRPTESQDIPELSGSLDSVADEEFDAEDSTSTSAAVDICRPQVRRQDSMHQSHSRSRGRERHITPDDLEKMVITIKEKKDLEPLSLKNHSYLAPLNNKKVPEPKETSPEPASTITTESKTPSSQSSQSSVNSTSMTDSQSSTRSATSVVRGFSPSQVSSSYRSIPLLTAPSSIPSDDLAAKAPAAKKQPTFALGGSSGDDSYSEQTNSMESNVQPTQPKKKTMFSFGGASSNEDESSLPKRMQPQSQLTAALKKPTKPTRTSFKDEIATRTIQEEQVSSEDPFESDDEEVDESAIDDDDDSSEWEDSVEESGRSSIDDKTFFQRVDSQVHLPSRRSLLTTMLHQNDRKSALAAAAGASRSTPALRRSRTSSPNGPSAAGSPESDDNGGLMMKKGLKSIAENGRAQPMAINTRSASSHNLALSPRTTRRNMLATELTVSLRQHLLWERKQKSQTANAVLKRRHTSHDVPNLKQYPDKVHMSDDKELNNSWNEYFSTGLGEYHSKGW
ncbi:hypothetical protein F5884DRAFT_207079 [Xylogone sp. PMI_703]|nr:hypothetical protein F5884DRAFT_207079 [Xylogone sp. PMI_703]